MITLGINAAFHDSSACLVMDGRVIAAAEEERFTGIKHAKRPVPFSTWELPFNAIDFCLRHAEASLSDVDHVAYSFDPYLLLGDLASQPALSLPLEPSAAPAQEGWKSPWDPLFLASVVNAPRFLTGAPPHHLKQRFAGEQRFQWHFVEHHLAHAASAFLPSPFPEAAVLTLDGRGEIATTSYSHGRGTHLERLGQVDMPNSLGLLYERVTDHLGFLHASDEYKVMALASYGEPRYLPEFRSIVRVTGDGQYAIDAPALQQLLGAPRAKGAPFEQRHFDIAASLQEVLEESVLELSSWLHDQTGARHLCLAGGVALNCVMNSRLLAEGPFERIWVQPAAGDAGTALGAALWLDAAERGEARAYEMDDTYLGPEYDDAEIESFLRTAKLAHRRVEDVPGEAARLLSQDQIVAWFQGRMEFGPRALGARSILASPLKTDMQQRLNELKDREDFRPVAPVVLEEEAADWFEIDRASPFMLFVHRVRPETASRIPAVCHVDGTARVQTVRRDQDHLLYETLMRFKQLTGVPVLVNTSFNTRGRPIVCTPRDAVEAFMTSPLDALVIGRFILEKPDRP